MASGSDELRLLALPIRYSSWTVRPIALLEYFDIPYSAQWYCLADPESLALLHKESPSGLVPVIIAPELPQPIHDSFAIGEYLNERYPEKGLWPENIALRTYGRSIVAELHSGFVNIRTDLAHNFPVKYNPPPELSEKVKKEVRRVLYIFETARKMAAETLGTEDGGFLLGKFSIADAFYWPILSRFFTYSVDVSAASPDAVAYISKMWKEPKLKKIGEMQFKEVAEHPEYNVPHYDNFVPNSKMEFWDIDKLIHAKMTTSLKGVTGLPTGFVLPPLQGLDLDDKKDLTTQIYAVNICMVSLVTLALLMRLYGRIVLIKKLQLEDILVILGTVTALALSTLCLYVTVHLGLGVHVWMADLTTVVEGSISLIKMLFAMVVLYSFSLTMAKCSVIALYLRIFAGIRWFQNALYSILALIILFFVLTFFITIFQCHPIEAAFDFRIALTKPTKCIVIKDFFYVSGSVNMLTDFLLVLLPMPLAWKLELDLRKRILIIVLFGLGILVSVASIVRITTLDSLGSMDITFSITGSLLWSIIEANVALICASGPAIKPLFTRLIPHLSKSVPTRTIHSNPTVNGELHTLNSSISYPERLRPSSATTFAVEIEVQIQSHTIVKGQSHEMNDLLPYVSHVTGSDQIRSSSHRNESTPPSRTSFETDSFVEINNTLQPEPLSPPPAIRKGNL
ncbi:hypothetical protein H072_4520 [Dactylellina haptotyla CBS 200.50]|uniref:GST N-terminal domain-containing protein n=1 Tax=Dactylellina haptotyla (strain CBS 200.50) TaxID=1284197 RepID=S8AF88_DACHA|nr:hypothetical protein H072_4520 [Dactylellina haptotyla CBS 200.50]